MNSVGQNYKMTKASIFYTKQGIYMKGSAIILIYSYYLSWFYDDNARYHERFECALT